MSVKLMAQVFYMDGMSPAEKLVLLALADHADDDTGECWPSMTTLARKSCQSERNVRRMIRRLEELGHLVSEAQGGRANRYIVLPTPDKLSAPTPDKLSAHPGHSSVRPPRTQLCPPNHHITTREPGGGGRERDAFIDQIIGAAKAEPGSSHWFDPAVWQAVSRWRGYGLDDLAILGVVRGVMEGRAEPPSSPAYFDKAMQREAEGARPMGRVVPPLPRFEIAKVLGKREAEHG